MTRINLVAFFVAFIVVFKLTCSPNVMGFTHEYDRAGRAHTELRKSADNADNDLTRWMANYLAIRDFECRYRRYSVSQSSEQRIELLKGNPAKDDRGYYLLTDQFLKFRPRDRLYFQNGHQQTAGDGGGFRQLLIAHDGVDHRTFVDEVYSGLIKPDPDLSMIPHPYHLISGDSDLEQLYKRGAIIREGDLVYSTKVEAYSIRVPGQNPPPSFNQIKFQLSPEHGYMPKKIEIAHEFASASTTYEIESFERLDGIWFPVSAKSTVTSGAGNRSVSLLEVDVATLKLNQGLKPADFHFEFPPGSGYMNISTGEKVIGEEYTRRQMLEFAAAQQVIEPPHSTRWVWFLCLAVAGCLILWSLFRRFA